MDATGIAKTALWLSEWLSNSLWDVHIQRWFTREVYWRRRADSNRRMEVLQTSALDHLATSPIHPDQPGAGYLFVLVSSGQLWCRGRDSNPHALTSTAPSTLLVYQFQHLGRCPHVAGSWQERRDSNPRPPVLETGALAN